MSIYKQEAHFQNIISTKNTALEEITHYYIIPIMQCWFWNDAPLTHRQEMPGDGRCRKAGKDVICAGEMREVRISHGLTPTLTPHQYLTALCLCCWCVAGVTRGNLHHSAKAKRVQGFIRGAYWPHTELLQQDASISEPSPRSIQSISHVSDI